MACWIFFYFDLQNFLGEFGKRDSVNLVLVLLRVDMSTIMLNILLLNRWAIIEIGILYSLVDSIVICLMSLNAN